MKVLKKGRDQKGWSKQTTCTGEGNGDGGCGAVLLVEQPDMYKTYRHCRDETDVFVTFTCTECGVETDIEDVPYNIMLKIPDKKDIGKKMKPELDERLCREFPHLYRDRNRSMQETCMVWGFECGDGWYTPIYKLSVKLEALILKYIAENEDTITCRYCSRTKHNHTKFYSFENDGNTFINIKDVVEYTSKNKIDPTEIFTCESMDYDYPCASQVKEKYGGLRFYTTGTTPEVEQAIDEAEEECSKTCEDCGKVGELCINGGWYRTLCEECVDTYNKGVAVNGSVRIRNYIQYSKLKELEEKEEDNGSEKETKDQESNEDKK